MTAAAEAACKPKEATSKPKKAMSKTDGNDDPPAPSAVQDEGHDMDEGQEEELPAEVDPVAEGPGNGIGSEQ